MNPEILYVALDAANIFCAVLLGLRVIATEPRSPTAQLIGLLTIAAVCHVVLARYDYGGWIERPFRIDVGAWRPLLNLIRNAAPGLFMVVVRRLFAEDRRTPVWLLGLFAVQLVLEEPARLFLPPVSPSYFFVTQIVPTALQMLFAGFALYWTIENWRVDLVEERRRARALVAVVLGVNVVASSLLLRVVIPQNSLANYQAHLVLSLCNLIVIAFVLFRLMNGTVAVYLEPHHPQPVMPRADSGETALALSRLRRLLEQEHIYRQPGLSIAMLASRVGVPEYRLRRLIHEELGHRNFNSFLHGYRIKEACERLRDPQRTHTPILTIALEVGYQSINTFNRAFRDVTGTTPSAYRSSEPPAPETK